MLYLLIKTLHILSSVILVGTGFGSAFYLFWANRSSSIEAIAVTARRVVVADWCLTAPCAVIQPLSGALMIHMAGYPLDAFWLRASFALYGVAGLCWLPVVWLQVRMARIAGQAAASGQPLPYIYWSYAKRWEWLGLPAFTAMVGVYFLMVLKPA